MGELEQILQDVQGLLVCVALIVGGLQCFFGYKLFRAMTAIIGFIVGGVIGAVVGGITAGETGAIIGLLALGILGALLAYSLYKLGVFVICFGAGAMVGVMLLMMMNDRIEPALVGVCGLILGIVGVVLTKPVIILSTGIGGGMSMGVALSTLLEGSEAGIILGVILAAVGVFLQFYLDKKNGGSDAPDAAGTAQQPGFQFKRAPARRLTKDDLTSQQAIYGAVTFGLCGFVLSGCGLVLVSGFAGVLLTIFDIAIFAGLGAYQGGRWNSIGREFFHADEAAIKDRTVAYGAAIGAAAGIVAGMLAGSASKHFAIGACIFCACVLYGTVMGYLAEMRRRFEETYGISVKDAFKLPAAAPAAGPEEAPAPSSGFYNTAPDAPGPEEAAPASSGFYNRDGEAAPQAAVRDIPAANGPRLWAEGLPIVVTETSVTPKPEDATLASLSLTFQNLGGQPVIAVYFGVRCFNLINQELEPVEKMTVQDFVLEPGESKTYTYPRALPDGDTRRVELIVRHVVMADHSTWDCEEGKTLTALEGQPPLQLDDHLAWQFFLDCSGLTKGYSPKDIFKYQPQRFERHWNCACGQLNLGEACLTCGIGREDLFERIDRERLQKNYDLRQEEAERRAEEQRRLEGERQKKLAEQRQAIEEDRRRQEEEERRREEEHRQQIEAQKQAARAAAAAVKDATARTAREVTDKTVKTAKKSAAAAKEWGKKIWTEKIYPNRKKLVIVLCAVAAVAIGAFAVRQYQIRAEAERVRVEQELEAQRRAEERAEAERRRAAEEQAEAERRKAEEEAQRQAAMQAEFDQIIADARARSYAVEDTRLDGYRVEASGTCYIDYIDFNGDGQEELVVGRVSNSCWVEFGGPTAEFRLAVYGGAPYEVAAWDDTRYELRENIEEQAISLVKCGGEVYIKTYEVEGDRASGAYTERSIYQAFDTKYSLSHIETQETTHAADGTVTRRSDPAGGPANVYTDEVTLVTLSQSPGQKKAVVGSWGMLPEIPEAMQWMPPRVYTTRYAEVNGADFPAFCFICPEGWTVTEESVDQSSETVTLENGRGAKVTFSHSLDVAGGGNSIFTENVEVSKAAESSFGDKCNMPRVELFSGTYSIRSFGHGLGPLMVARISRAEGSAGDGAALAYAVLPETETGTHEAPYSASFSLSSYGSHSTSDVIEQDYGSVSIIAEGSLTGQDEADVARILASFCSYSDALS